jgi:hypothetical protein
MFRSGQPLFPRTLLIERAHFAGVPPRQRRVRVGLEVYVPLEPPGQHRLLLHANGVGGEPHQVQSVLECDGATVGEASQGREAGGSFHLSVLQCRDAEQEQTWRPPGPRRVRVFGGADEALPCVHQCRLIVGAGGSLQETQD